MPDTIGVLSILEGALMDEARRLWRVFETQYASRGVQSSLYPHLTFQGGSCGDVSTLRDELPAFARGLRPFELIVDGLDCFESSRTVFLKVIPSDELKTIHQTINDWLKSRCEILFELYLPEKWIPHITIAMNDLTEDNLRRAVIDLETYDCHFRQAISNLHLVQLSKETGHIESIGHAHLGT